MPPDESSAAPAARVETAWTASTWRPVARADSHAEPTVLSEFGSGPSRAGQPAGAEPVVIDLGAGRGEPDGDAATGRRAPRSRWAPLLLAILVLVSGGASAAPPAPPLEQLLSVKVTAADSFALTDEGLLLLQAPGTGTLRAYELATGKLRWQATATAPTYGVRTGGGSVLLRPRRTGSGEPGTIALALSNGAARWRRAGSIVTVPGSPLLLAVNRVRSVSGFGGRISGQVDGVDPDTGRSRWTVTVANSAVLLAVPAVAGSPPRMLLVHDSGTARVHDLTTGRALASVELPPADYAVDNPAFFGDVLVLRHPTRAGSVVSAFDAATLRPRWSRPAGTTYRLQACGPLVCLIGRSGVRAVDPADGADRWDRPGWRGIEQNGGALLASTSLLGDAGLLGVVDPGTGEVTVPLSGWRPVPADGPSDGERILVTRAADVPGRTVVAVAEPGTAGPRLLGGLPVRTGDCRTMLGKLVCRSTSGELAVWVYR